VAKQLKDNVWIRLPKQVTFQSSNYLDTVGSVAFSDLTLSLGHQEERPARKKIE